MLTCIISLISLAFFFLRDGNTKTICTISYLCTFSWKIYIWKVKAFSSCNQLTLIISNLIDAISPPLGEVLKILFDH